MCQLTISKILATDVAVREVRDRRLTRTILFDLSDNPPYHPGANLAGEFSWPSALPLRERHSGRIKEPLHS